MTGCKQNATDWQGLVTGFKLANEYTHQEAGHVSNLSFRLPACLKEELPGTPAPIPGKGLCFWAGCGLTGVLLEASLGVEGRYEVMPGIAALKTVPPPPTSRVLGRAGCSSPAVGKAVEPLKKKPAADR